MKKMAIVLVLLLIAVAAVTAIGESYPQVEAGNSYIYCSQLQFNHVMRMDTTGDIWTATPSYRPDKCY